MNILFIGDVVGRPGRNYLSRNLPRLIEENSIDFTIVNGENSAGGIGITKNTYDELVSLGIDMITLGNHSWVKKEILEFIEESDKLVRPANYPNGAPGMGYRIAEKSGRKIAVINLCGRVYMDCIECPFKTIDAILSDIKEKADIIIVDFHAEATSEKLAMGWYLDGKVHAVLGTHTHVQTSDERILPCGTAYITDVGMTGPKESVLGVEKETVIRKFMTGMPARFEVAGGEAGIGAAKIQLDDSNKVIGINRIME
ncbi:MAG TPA: TIGR00282 family metallophosphoesterase [Bacillota bacterium]|nr:TIGR00282 family metallophosphoesterase [Bacillota bacterium]HPL52977.1 TIGR00282 family metallophosphoesterase [Bacillota bacterium]